MIGIVIPVHNEEQLLHACLSGVIAAAHDTGLGGEAVKIVAVMDACHDGSAAIARRHGVETLTIHAGNVGAARAAGADYLLACGARWLAFTDADSVVAPNWLATQLELDADLVCGTVKVTEWEGHPAQVRRAYEAGYRDCDGHRHVHGANLGVSAQAYAQAGGFSALQVHEDVALVDAVLACGAYVVWTAAPRVTTSARRDCRIEGGFGSFLAAMHEAAADDAGTLPLMTGPAADLR